MIELPDLFMLASAAGQAIQNSASSACAGGCGNSDINAIFRAIVNALIFIVGAVSVIMIIVGGFRYVISNGEPKNVEAAKNTILYSIIGIVVALASFAIVSFIATKTGL